MATPTSVDDYLASLPEEQQAALQALRATIKAAAPEATETISYQMPAFKANGRFLVSYAAFKDHFSLFPASEAVREATRRRARAVPLWQGNDPLRNGRAAYCGARDEDGRGPPRGDRNVPEWVRPEVTR